MTNTEKQETPPRDDAASDHDDPAKRVAHEAAQADLDGNWKQAARFRRLGVLAKRRD